MEITWENQIRGDKFVPAPVDPSQILHGQAWFCTKDSAVIGRRLTAWAQNVNSQQTYHTVLVTWLLASVCSTLTLSPYYISSHYYSQQLNHLATDFFFQILAHPVFKMWVIQKPNKVALWNKRHFEEKKWRLYKMFKIFSTDISWINMKWDI